MRAHGDMSSHFEHAFHAAGDAVFVNTSAGAYNSTAVLLPSTSDAALSSVSVVSVANAVVDVPLHAAQDSTLPSRQDAALPSSDTPATAADQPVTSAGAVPQAAAGGATSEQWTPSPPLVPAVRPVAPRPTALFHRSISAMPHAAHFGKSKYHDASALGDHHISAIHRARPKLGSASHHAVNASANWGDADLWGGDSRQAVLKRPATAGQARTETALHQVLGVPPSRPQTAAAAGRARPSTRWALHGVNCSLHSCYGYRMQALLTWRPRHQAPVMHRSQQQCFKPLLLLAGSFMACLINIVADLYICTSASVLSQSITVSRFCVIICRLAAGAIVSQCLDHDAVEELPPLSGCRGPHRQAQLPWTPDDLEGSMEMPHSPVRERMKNAVERESCLR